MENDKPTTAGYWVKLALVALAMRMLAAFYLFLVVPQGADAAAYAKQAVQIMTGEDKGHPYFFPPGRSYCLIPFFLVFGESDTTCRANAVVFDVACVLAAAALAHQVLRRRSAARMTGWIAAFYPPAVMISGWCYAENVTMLALMGGVSFAVLGFRTIEERGWRSLPAWFLSGCFLGLAIVTRPSAFSVLFVAIAGWIGFWALRCFRPGLFGAAGRVPSTLVGAAGMVFSLAALGCVVPPIAHHVWLKEGWVVSANNELNFFLGNNAYTPHYKTWHTPRARAPLAYQATRPISHPFRAGEIHEVPCCTRQCATLGNIRLSFCSERPTAFALSGDSTIPPRLPCGEGGRKAGRRNSFSASRQKPAATV